MFLYDLRLQTTTDTYNAISSDGVNLGATINIRFRLKHDSIPQLHQGIGPNYIARLVRPEIGNRTREIIAEYTAEEIYSTKRQEIQKRIRTHTEAMLGLSTMERTKEESEYGEHYRVTLDAILNLYDTLILGLELPQPVIAAINRKIEQYYLVQEYAFRVERERKESERKLIEAQGIRAFQETVSQGISDSYVRWRGIEATLQLAQSNNAKIVIIGSGKDGLPIILGNVDAPLPKLPGAASPDAPPPSAPLALARHPSKRCLGPTCRHHRKSHLLRIRDHRPAACPHFLTSSRLRRRPNRSRCDARPCPKSSPCCRDAGSSETPSGLPPMPAAGRPLNGPPTRLAEVMPPDPPLETPPTGRRHRCCKIKSDKHR